MGLMDGVRRQLRSVIEWKDPAPDLLFFRWTDNGDEIKNASKLIVGPGQGCVFVYEGQVRSVLVRECMVDLRTANIPFWTTIKKFMQLFESEHKVWIYYFRKATVLNQKWGTSSPIKYMDPTFKIPVELKAYGNYSLRITDPESFFVNVVAGSPAFLVSDLREVMSQRLIQPLTDLVAEARHSYVDIDANRDELSRAVAERLLPDFDRLGFALTDFRIEGVDFDEGTKRRIGRIADLSAEAQAAGAAGLDYTRVQQLDALREAARNEGGAAGVGIGLGAGMGLGQTVSGAFGGVGAGQPPGTAPEAPAARLKQLKELLAAELISEEEYAAKKKQLLDRL
ncbi:MAG: SPFH domain-containing protein [Deferrisomatales bacterium]